MIKETLLNFDMLYLPVVALMIFLIMFSCVLYWVYRKDNRALYKHMSELPYEEDEFIKEVKKDEK